jgi:uncharacterized surface protein with fasciclin (FAS1) repeats
MKVSSRAVAGFSAALLLALVAGLGTPAPAKPAKALDICDSVASNRITTKMAAMIQASDLATFMSSRGPFTLFVPTDSAFAKWPPGELEQLLLPENKDRLQHILLFHLVNGKKLTAKDLLPLKTVLTCEGSQLPVRASKSGTQYVLKSRIIHADIKCLNGLIHEIDTVLMPPESALPPLAPPRPPPVAQPVNDNETNAPSASTNAAPVETAAPATNVAPAAPIHGG